jgi:hypothetical protein
VRAAAIDGRRLVRRVQLSGITATGGCFGGTNGHQIVVADPPDVACSKSDQGLGATRGSDEFHLGGIGQVDIHDCAQIAAFSAPEPEGPCSARRHHAPENSSGLTQPVFAGEAVDPGELPLIVGDEGIAECHHLRRDEQVVAADWRTRLFEASAE